MLWRTVALGVLLVGCGGETLADRTDESANTDGASSTAGASASSSAASSSASSSSGSSGSTGEEGDSDSSSSASSSSSSGSDSSSSSSSSSSATSASSSSSSTASSSSSSTGSSGSHGSTSGSTGGGSTGSTTALLRPSSPMPCADPAVVSEAGAGQTFFVYCTGMSHVWKTSDWTHFSDVRGSTTFDLSGMSANGKNIGSWWAPGVLYAPGLAEYVMWVSVPDSRGTNVPGDGWDTRSIAVLTADDPEGPWTYRGLGIAATAVGQHFIDPFLFRDHDGGHYVFWKQYGGGVDSRIMGSKVTSSWLGLSGSRVDIMNGYGGTGTWEDNVRENPAVWYDASTGHHHLIFSGGHWADDSYGTGHAVSTCGPLCVSGSGSWHMVDSGDRGVVQVVQSNNDANFTHGGPGGAVVIDDAADVIVYAASAKSADHDSKRYLMMDHVKWSHDAPYVDTAHHRPEGL